MAASSDALTARFRTGAMITAATVGAVGLTVLIGGWWLDVEVLRQPLAGLTAMRAGTALAFVVVAAGLLCSRAALPQWISGLAGVAVAVGGTGVLIGYAIGAPKLAPEGWVALRAALDDAVPGRIAVNTAACFVLLGIGTILLSLHRGNGLRQALGVASAFLAYTALIGYATTAFQVAGRFTPDYTEMALHTAIPMLAAGCALTLVSLESGWARVFAEPLAGGQLARTFLPATLVLFLLASWLYGVLVGPTVTVGATYTLAGLAVVTSTGLLIAARRLQRVDEEREFLATDIDARIADRTLRLQQAISLLQAQFDQAPNGLALVSLTGRCLDGNRALCELLGTDALVGVPADELFASEDRPRVHELVARADAGEAASRLVVRAASFRADELWVRLSVSVVRDENAEPIVHLFAFEDITAQEEARRALADSERRYRLVADNANDAVLWEDPAGIVKWASPSVRKVLGLDPDEVRGMDATELVVQPGRRQLRQVQQRAAQGETGISFDLQMRTRHRGVRWMAGTTGPAVDEDGTIVGRISMFRDVDDQVAAREALERSERLFRLAMDGAPQGMAVVSLDLSFLQVNASLCGMVGAAEDAMRARTLTDLLSPDELAQFTADVHNLVSGATDGVVRERRWLRSDGQTMWMVDSVGLLRDEHGEPLFLVLHAQDNTVAHRVRDELAQRANHDPLTGLLNSDQMRQHLESLLARESAQGSTPAVLFFDVDHFKAINDTYGHDVGDEVLKITATRIATVVRGGDVVARSGGDEFVVVLAGVPDVEAGMSVADKIRRAVREPLPVGTSDLSISISAGIALAGPGAGAQRLLRAADAALYQAKRSGRDQVAMLDEGTITREEVDIRQAMARREFVPWFQPIVRLDDATVIGHEALVRRIDPSGAVQEPDRFLVAAERSRLIVDLDLSILEQALSWLRDVPAPLHVSVNVSGATIVSPGYAERVASALARTGVDPARLHLEITETALLRVTASLKRTMATLAELGVRWFVDDFGVGYSSMAHLRDLPIAGLKLDRSFTANVHERRGEELVRALGLLADGLGLDSVAEGIETSAQADLLAARGWRNGQGWLFGRPTPGVQSAGQSPERATPRAGTRALDDQDAAAPTALVPDHVDQSVSPSDPANAPGKGMALS